MDKNQLVIKGQALGTDEVQEILAKVEAFLEQLKMEWDAENQESGTVNWFSLNRIKLLSGTIFILQSLDKMIQFVEGLIPAGEDKKAVVMVVAGRLFDYIVAEAFPLVLKPFVPTIRRVVIDVIIGSAIDFIVKKYNEGSWKMNGVSLNGQKN